MPRPPLDIENPSTGEPFGTVAASEDVQISAAVANAYEAFGAWRRRPAEQRAAALREVANRVEADVERLAIMNAAETGKLIGDARGGVLAGVATLRQYAELGPLHRGRSLNGDWTATDLMVHEPYGVAAVITPWNDPVAVAGGLLGAALVTGNTVVFKPSERAPHIGSALAAHFSAVLPTDVFAVLQGDAGVGAAVFGGAPGGAARPRKASGARFGYGPELLDEMVQTKVVHISPAG